MEILASTAQMKELDRIAIEERGIPSLELMENAAQSAIAPFLEEGRGSVGTHLDVFHNAPTPIGMTVHAEAEVLSVSENGKMIDFAVRAWDDAGPIGEGKHTRAIIHNERFLQKCNSKLEK